MEMPDPLQLLVDVGSGRVELLLRSLGLLVGLVEQLLGEALSGAGRVLWRGELAPSPDEVKGETAERTEMAPSVFLSAAEASPAACWAASSALALTAGATSSTFFCPEATRLVESSRKD